MPSYNVFNSRGTLVTTIGVATTTGTTFPVELIGQGISLYGPIVAQNQYFILENFAKGTPPINPVEGMLWYNSDIGRENFYNGTNFVELSSAGSSASHAFVMDAGSVDVDFTTAGSTVIFTAPSTAGVTHHPTGVILIPKVVNDGGLPPITPATFHLYIDSVEDVMENAIVVNHATNRHGYFPIYGMTRFAAAAETIKLQIVSPATGAGVIQLTYDVVVFGYQNIS